MILFQRRPALSRGILIIWKSLGSLYSLNGEGSPMTRFRVTGALCRYLPVFLLLLANITFAGPNSDTRSSPPNIILIMSDYMGYSDITPFGSTAIDTPALAALANAGVRYSSHYASAPMCIPSRASLMSGMYPSKVLKQQGLPAQKNTLLNELKQAGYSTALIGKWHLGMEKGFKPTDQGFDYFFGFNSWTLGHHSHLTSDGEPGLYRNNELIEEEGYLTDLFAREAVDFVESSVDKPFFLFLSFNGGLPPYQRPDLPKALWNTGWDVNKSSLSDYIAMIESMDRGIAKLLLALKQQRQESNTLVLFTYDHGGRHHADSGNFFHGFSTLWEGGIRVPLIIRWPDGKYAGDTVATPTIAMDLTATMLELAGRPNAGTTLDGISLVDIESKQRDRAFFWSFKGMKAVRKENWKYVVDGHTQFLFDLDTDPAERHNLFGSHISTANVMRRALREWEATLSD